MPKRLARSVGHAINGFLHVWRGERNFRLQCLGAVLALGIMVWFEFTAVETAIMIICMAAVLGAEMFNTFVEDLMDVVHPDHHPQVGKIKDLMAGIVLFACVAALIVGVITVWHHVRL